MNKKVVFYCIIAFIMSFSILFVGFDNNNKMPKEVYHVYLEGKSIGYINSKEELENYIDQEQQHLKEKYNVTKVYAPKDLDIIREYTYEGKISSTKQIYNKIKDIKPFTLNGYTITIQGTEEQTESGETKKTEDEVIYVLDKEVFNESIDKMIRTFVDSDQYDAFLNESQAEVVNAGKFIEDIDIQNTIKIKKENIPADEPIYTTVEDLSKYLLFGTLDEQEKYTVQSGDTIEDVAFNNKISPEEFLIANSEFKDVNNLLFPGQEVVLGILQPKIKVVEENYLVEIRENKFKTEIRYDNEMLLGTSKVIQKGENGQSKVTQKIQLVNGEIKKAAVASEEELKQVVNEIIVKGGKNTYYGDAGLWAWPTATPYIVTSGFGYRWGVLHDGIDISGAGYGSPIYAANSGFVEVAGYTSINGNYVIINHNNGYYSMYAHMADIYVKSGQTVELGQTIVGTMGNSGNAYGTHLHFGIYKGYPFRRGTVPLDPRKFY